MAVEERTLPKELFSGDEQAKLLELLEQATRARLPPAISNFLQRVEGIIQNSATQEKTEQQETKKHPNGQPEIIKLANEPANAHNFPAQAVETVTHAVLHDRRKSAEAPPISEEITGLYKRGTTQERIREFLYRNPDASLRALVEHTGATVNAVKSGVTTLKSYGQVEFDRLRLTEYGRSVVEGGRASPEKPKQAEPPAAEKITTRHTPVTNAAEITKTTQKRVTDQPVTTLPDDLAFSSILESAIKAIKKLSFHDEEAARKQAIRILGERKVSEYPYDYYSIRAFEEFAWAVKLLSEGSQSADKLLALVYKMERNQNDPITLLKFLKGFQGDVGSEQRNRPPERRGIRPRIQHEHGTRQTTHQHGIPEERIGPPKPTTAQKETPRTYEDCMSSLTATVSALGERERAAVRSYAWKLAGVDDKTQNVQLDPIRLRRLGTFTTSFERIQKFDGLPAELYDVLGGFNDYDDKGAIELNEELHAAKDSFDVLSAVSKRAISPYALRVDEMGDIYREDPKMVQLLRERDGFHSATINARNNIPRLRAGQFYETLKKIKQDENWGGRYTDVLRLAGNDPRKALNFFSWAVAQQNFDGYRFDTEMRKYMQLGSRAQPATREDPKPSGHRTRY